MATATATATESAADVRRVSLDEIRLDGQTQCRVELSEQTVKEYAESLVGDFDFPPLVVYFDGSDYWLAHGFHRYFAYKRTHHDDAPCEVHEGTREDAQWHSYSANKTQLGLRRSNADKQRAVKLALEHPNAANLSNGVIAAHVGVDEGTIRNYRKKEESTPEVPELNGRQGRDGKVRNTRKSNGANGSCAPNGSAAKTAGSATNSGNSGVEPEETREELEAAAESYVDKQDNDVRRTCVPLSTLYKLLEAHIGKAVRTVDDISNSCGGDDKFIRAMREGLNASKNALNDFRRARR